MLMAMRELKASEHGWVAALDDGRRLDAVPFKTKEEAFELVLQTNDHVPMPLVALEQGVPCSMQLREFLHAEDMEPPFEESSAERNNNPFIDYEDDWIYLDDSWNWADIEANAWKRLGHRTTGIKHRNVGELLVKAVYDLEDSLRHVHPRVNSESVANFIGSWNVWFHLCQFREQLKSSPTVKRIVAKPDEPHEALTAVNYCLWSYVHQLRSEDSSHQERWASARMLVLDQYMNNFSAKRPDIGWAANQRKKEFDRWINGKVKPGSKPDTDIRRVLTSGKSPTDLRSEERPKRWWEGEK